MKLIDSLFYRLKLYSKRFVMVSVSFDPNGSQYKTDCRICGDVGGRVVLGHEGIQEAREKIDRIIDQHFNDGCTIIILDDVLAGSGRGRK